ncbi:ribonuclease HI family protein [Lacticaseibacillus brantae]|uniref:Ribonuclease HI n=1 Tax=Lacticaseibacillus brantae DSM 23927 TaxID=1423727 RepID=A0A0R2B088_9LACO|nr:ribonuclease HI family protein [Lacticaseibacillus brantae]KRM72655.1 ribonuclease HI [Lacticaseibacillus brantae DSM 23927]
MLKLYTDAATKGNPGFSGAGVLIVNQGQQIQQHYPLGVMSNHEAEFEAAILGFSYLIDKQLTTDLVSYTSDSKLVIDALDKRYAKHYPDLIQRLLAVVDQVPNVIWQWQADANHHGAHSLAQQGLAESLASLNQ